MIENKDFVQQAKDHVHRSCAVVVIHSNFLVFGQNQELRLFQTRLLWKNVAVRLKVRQLAGSLPDRRLV